MAGEDEDVDEALRRDHGELPPDQGVAGDRRERLRQAAGDGFEARPRAAGQDHDLTHVSPRSAASSEIAVAIAAKDERRGRHPSRASFSIP